MMLKTKRVGRKIETIHFKDKEDLVAKTNTTEAEFNRISANLGAAYMMMTLANTYFDEAEKLLLKKRLCFDPYVKVAFKNAVAAYDNFNYYMQKLMAKKGGERMMQDYDELVQMIDKYVNTPVGEAEDSVE